MAARERRWFRYSLRSTLVLFTIAIVSLGWLSWQRSIVQERQRLVTLLLGPGDGRGSRGRAFEGSPRGWTIRPYCVVKTKTLVLDPPRTTAQLSAIRRWFGDKPYAVIVLRNETACPGAREAFPEAAMVVLNRDGVTVRGMAGRQRIAMSWPVSWTDPPWPTHAVD